MRKSIKAIICAASAAVVCAAPTVATFAGTAATIAITASAASDNVASITKDSKGNEIAVLNNLVYEFDLSARKAVLAGRYSNRTEISSPATVIIKGVECQVKEVKDGAFRNGSSIKKVDLSGCTYLEKIGNHAFEKTTSTTIKLNTKLQTIGVGAFKGTNVSEVTIPGGTTLVANSAFMNCRYLSYVFFQSASVAGLNVDTPLKIQNSAFANDSKLTRVNTYRKKYNIEPGAFTGTNITSYEGVGRNDFASQYKK